MYQDECIISMCRNKTGYIRSCLKLCLSEVFLERTLGMSMNEKNNLSEWEIDVVQVLQNVDADVDAIWRLQNPLPLRWHTPEAIANGESLIAIDPSSFAL